MNPGQDMSASSAAPRQPGERDLVSQLLAEQRCQWAEGQRLPVEDYLRRHPELSASPEKLLDLIYNEIVQREDTGDRPRLEEYLQRFPQLGPQLRVQFEVHRLIEADGDTLVTGVEEGSASAGGEAVPDPAPVLAAGIPGYDILDELGRGGMGIVFRARQRDLNRVVALKLIPPSPATGLQEWNRLRNEAEAAACLQHPNIVQIYEVGARGGYPYLVLEFVDGGSLETKLGGEPQPAVRAAELVEVLARAVHYAHQQGIIHRDLKPGNILLTADGSPKITDFGLAKQLKGDSQTQSGVILGTPSYMAPEQAAGRPQEISPASDTYALGAILYELLTGRPPFHGADVVDTLEQVRTREPVPPRQLQPRVPRDLETLCLKCLQKEPRKRYPSALALAEDLHRFLAGEPIQARPVQALERLWRWCRRNPRVAVLAATVFTLLLAITAVSVTAAILIERQRLLSERKGQETVQALDLLTELTQESLADDIPRMELRQQEVLEKALRLRKELLKEEPTSPEMRKELALANYRVGRIWKNLRRSREAEEAFRQAIALFRPLVRAFPNEREYRHYLAMSHNDLGEVLRATGSLEPESHYRAALKAQSRLEAEAPERPEYHQELARTYNNLGIFLQQTDRAAEAKEAYGRAIDRLRALEVRYPAQPVYRADLARSYINLGVLLEAREPAESERAYRSAIALLEGLRAVLPNRYDYEYKRAAAYNNLGNLLWHSGTPDAVQARRVLLAVFDRYQLGATAARWGDRTGRSQEAEAALHTAMEVFEKLVKSFPDYHLYEKELANSYNNLGNVRWDAGRQAEAEQAWAHAGELFEDLVARHPTIHEYRSLLGITLAVRGWLLLYQDQILEFRQVALRLALDGPTRLVGLAAAQGLRVAHRPALEEARRLLSRAVDQQQAAWQANPYNPEYRNRLGHHYRNLALVLERLGKGGLADEAREQAKRLAAR